MKRLLILSFILVMVSVAVRAQEKRLSAAPQSFRTFFATFKVAVAKSDKTRVANMTQFPFAYGFDAGDEGKMTTSHFIKRFADVFGKNPKEFVAERNPLFSRGESGRYTISTEDAAHLMFKKIKGTYKFTMYIVEP